MSLVVTVYVPEGLVMAADSRLTLEFQGKGSGVIFAIFSFPC